MLIDHHDVVRARQQAARLRRLAQTLSAQAKQLEQEADKAEAVLQAEFAAWEAAHNIPVPDEATCALESACEG